MMRKRGRVPGKQVSLPAAPSYGIVPKGTWFIGWIGISSTGGNSRDFFLGGFES